MSRSWAGGSTWAWRQLRTHILDRDQHTCQIRLTGCLGQATHVHHTKGRAITGDDPRYLVAACAPCNLTLGDPTRRCDPRPTPVTTW